MEFMFCVLTSVLPNFQMLPLDTNIREAYANGQDAEQQFIQNLALFLCTFLKERGSLVEKKQLSDALLKVCPLVVKGKLLVLVTILACN